MPRSSVALTISEDKWLIHLRLPADRVSVALAQAGIINSPETVIVARDVLIKYVLARLQVKSLDGQLWQQRITQLQAPANLQGEWQVDVQAVAPHGLMPEQAWLVYTVIINEIATHEVIVSLKQDWQRGVTAEATALLGTLRAEDKALLITREKSHEFRAWQTMFMLGVHHIINGVDHLLFLLMLIMAAPLVAIHKSWQPVARPQDAWRNATLSVTAFTLGHLLSLMVVTFGALPVGGKCVEVFIALSVGLSALNLLYPVFYRRELWIAVLFGLIHGAGFAEALKDLVLPLGQLVAATLCFNLGIEFVQLVIICGLLPLLLWTRHRFWFAHVRMSAAAITCMVSGVWVFQRIQ